MKAVLIDKNILCGHSTNYCFPKKSEIDIHYLLGILNSKIVDYYFKYFNNTNHVPIGELKNVPAPKATEQEQNVIGKLAKKILDLKKQSQLTEKNSNEWEALKNEIAKTDAKIDELVYQLYELTLEEIKIVEEGTK